MRMDQGTYSRRGRLLALFVAGLLFLVAAPSSAELGWAELDYVKRFGAPVRSPLTPNEAQFVVPKAGRVLVIFEGKHSREEAWLIDRGARFVPRELMRRARAAVLGTPVRRVEFRLEGASPAELFEERGSESVLQVDYRNGTIMRIARCRGPAPCTLLSRLLDMELATDDLMARTQAQMRREGQ